MARPIRYEADYFPFYVKEGRTLFVLKRRYGLQGIGFFTEVLRLLTRTPYHFIRLQDESDEIYFWETVGIEQSKGEEMMDVMVQTKKIHKELWQNYRTVACSDLVDSLQVLYSKRKAGTITIEMIVDSVKNNTELDVTMIEEVNSENTELSNEQRLQILEIFYFKNFIAPAKEYENFCNHYSKTGWKDKNGNFIQNPVSAAQYWKQENNSGKKIDPELLQKWRKVFLLNGLSETHKEAILNMKPKNVFSDVLTIYTANGLAEKMESNFDLRRPILDAIENVFGQKTKIEITKLW